MDCPVCRTPLSERHVQDVRVHLCTGCGGILYTRDTFRQHVARLRESPLEQLSTPELLHRKVIPQRLIPSEGKMCPWCNGAMSAFNYGYDSNIILDRCSKCELIWADRDEIVKVAQYVKGNPTIDGFGQALAEREMERVKYWKMPEQAQQLGAGGRTTVPFWVGILPLSDDQKARTIPVVTILLILVSIATFVALPQSTQTFYALGFIPDLFFKGKELYRIVTGEFLHAGFLHLAGNMLFLWIFGDNVEDRFGKVGFPLAYLLFGGAASITHAFLTFDRDIPCVGASGAISGVMGAYLVFFPHATVRTIVGRWIVPIPAFLFLGIWFLLQLSFSTTESSIAYFAHIGGFVIGATVAFAYKGVRKEQDV